MRKFKDISGNVYGKLTAVSLDGVRNKKTMWNCVCECGNTCAVALSNLLYNNTKSCGCSSRPTVHGMTCGKTRIPEHAVWTTMKSRCLNKADKNYHHYGGRGITVCDRWLESKGTGFKNFITDMGKRPSSDHSIERKNNNEGYSPDNCIWLHKSLQASNQRSNRKVIDNDSGVVYPTIANAARENGMSSGYLRDMLTGKRNNKTNFTFYGK